MNIRIIIIVILIGVVILIVLRRNTETTDSHSQLKDESERQHIKTANSIFYHEDDYLQVEIIPSDNFDELIKQAENVQDFAEKHFDGGGYTDIMVREENGVKLKEREIKPKELDLILSELPIRKCTDVSTGIRPGEIKSKNTYGYGENYNGIFFNFNSNSVTGIWIAGSPNIEDKILVKILNDIGKKWSLLLMDWNSLELVDLKDKEQIEKYLKDLLK
ncbi:hypothetical protein MHTCC0001_09500 [Flavobacteriaceae bacterium MHTCC 0001]